jgi:hypothetical protein
MLRTGVAVMAAGLVLLAGCTSTKDKPGGTASSGSAASAPAGDANAVAALNAAQQKTRSDSYHADVTVTTSASTMVLAANVDPQSRALEMTMDMQGTKMTIRLIGTDMYFTGLETSGLKGKWVHADMSKLPGVEGILASFDQTFALMDGTTDLKEDSPGTFTGSVDPKAALDKAQSAAAKDALSKIISAGSSGKLPFTAKVVDGYLVEVTTAYKMDQGGTTQEATIVSKFSQFGTAPKVTAPPKADTVDAS